MNGNNLLYIASFFGVIMGINMFAGEKATFYFLLLVLAGSAIVHSKKYSISISTPEIMKE